MLSKNTFFIGAIIYVVALLLLQDWPAMTATVGGISAAFLAKMVLDVVFAGSCALKLAGPSIFSNEDEDDFSAADLSMSDTALYGFFGFYVLANSVFHAYKTVMETDAVSFGYSVWFLAEVTVLLFTFVLFKHASAKARRLAREKKQQQSNIRAA